MTLEAALRASEVLLALAFLQQSAEHLGGSRPGRALHGLRAALSLVLLAGAGPSPGWALAGLALHSVLMLRQHDGPYNGGSDKMGLLVLYCLCLSRWLPPGVLQEAAFGYLGVQVVLSYFISGQVKISNPDWRSGQALQDVFRFSAYPVAEDLRGLADRPRLLWCGAWAVMLCEVLFPLSLLDPRALLLALVVTAVFHVANACLFGLNRFVWVWIASYPALIWLQARLMPGGGGLI